MIDLYQGGPPLLRLDLLNKITSYYKCLDIFFLVTAGMSLFVLDLLHYIYHQLRQYKMLRMGLEIL